jgi:hypothetical protein
MREDIILSWLYQLPKRHRERVDQVVKRCQAMGVPATETLMLLMGTQQRPVTATTLAFPQQVQQTLDLDALERGL